jgi:hypothetical protein
MGTDSVVDGFPMAQLAVEFFHLQRVGRDLIKHFRMGTVGALDRAVEFGGAGREHEQVQTALLASLLELSRELRPAVDLQGAEGKGHAVGERVSRNSVALLAVARVWACTTSQRETRSRAVTCWNTIPGTGGYLHGVDLDQIARLRHRVLPGLAHGIRPNS